MRIVNAGSVEEKFTASGAGIAPCLLASILSIGMTVLPASVAHGQEYPNRLIRVIVGGAGSGADFVARLIAQGLTVSLGQQVIIDNRPSGVIPGDTVSKAPPDGYTLLFIGNNLWLGTLLQKMPYDAVRDFSPIILAASQPNVLVVHPSVPVKSVKELSALARTRAGELNYASLGSGSSSHLAAELFKSMSGVNIVRIPYTGYGPALSDLIAGEVHLMFASAAAAAPHVQSRRLRALAVTTVEPSALVPGLPTVAAAGLPGYSAAALLGLLGPPRLSVTIVNRLNRESARVLNQADVKERLFNNGIEVVAGSSEQFSATIKSEMTQLDQVIKKAGIRAD